MSSVLINIDVPDIKTATQFYVNAFGLEVGRRFGDDFVELLGFPSPIYLLEKKEGTLPFPSSTSPRTFERHWTPVHMDLVVESIERAMEKAKAAGAKVESEIHLTPYGKLVLLSDPFGHGFCFLEFNDKGYNALITS